MLKNCEWSVRSYVATDIFGLELILLATAACKRKVNKLWAQFSFRACKHKGDNWTNYLIFFSANNPVLGC